MNLAQKLIEATHAKRKRIVVMGDAMIDHWVTGRLTGCQDNCQKFVEEGRATTPGGAHNAMASIAHWDVNADLFAFSAPHRPEKWRFVTTDGRIVFRWDDEPKPPDPTGYRWCYDQALDMIKHAGAVLLSDYDKGFLGENFVQSVAELCAKHGVPCVADCKRAPALYRGCILKGNVAWGVQNQPGRESRAYVETWGEDRPLVWEGERMTVVGDKLERVRCTNHVGAGDCFAAHLTLALAYGFPLKEAAALAHSAGRVYVQYRNNRAPYPAEVAEDMGRVVAEPAQAPAGPAR